MAKQTVNLGVIPDGVGGDDVRTGFTKTNENFTELYTVVPQAESEAGVAQTVRAWTSQRVRQAIAAWWSGVGKIGDGKVLMVGAGGVLGGADTSNNTLPPSEGSPVCGFFSHGGYAGGEGQYPFGFRAALAQSMGFIGFDYLTGQVRRTYVNALDIKNAVMYDSLNTTKDPDGTLHASSPVINIFTDKIELHNESQFGATPQFARKSKGVYEITGTLGLRLGDWYLNTPSDRNGNKYFNVEWTQNITPESVDGVVETYRDDIVVTVETFERVWNPATGLHENGDHVDINDMQDRFVQLRFNEIKQEAPEEL